MLLLRSVLYYIGISIFTLFIVAPAPLLYLLPPRIRMKFLHLWSEFATRWLRITCGLSFRVEGKENIPEGPAIILCKHQSAWETIAMQLIFPQQTWVLKRSLLFIPFFGWGLHMMKAIAIDRAAGKKALRQVIEQGKDRLKMGIWVVIFPEGTRMAPGETKKYAIGGAMLAAKSGYPVVPVTHNAGEYWPRNSFIKYPGVITLRVGPLIDSSDKDAGTINKLAESWIEGNYPGEVKKAES